MKTRRRRNPFAGIATQLHLLGALGALAAMTLANGDGGGDAGASGEPGGGDAGAGGAGGGTTATGTPPPPPTGNGTSAGKVEFTAEQQAHIDSLIAKATGKAKSTTEADIKKYLEQQGMDEADRLKAERDAAAAERDAARTEVLAAKVETTAERLALAAGCKPDRVTKLMRLIDLSDLDTVTADGKPDTDAIRAIVERELADTPELKGTAAAGQSGGDHAGAGETKTWTRDEIAKLSPEEFVKHEKEIDAAAQAGLIKA